MEFQPGGEIKILKKISLLQKRWVRIIDTAKTVSHTDSLFFKGTVKEKGQGVYADP